MPAVATARLRVDGAQLRSDIVRLELAAREAAVAERIAALVASGSQVVESRYDPRDGCLRLQLTEQFASLLAPCARRQAVPIETNIAEIHEQLLLLRRAASTSVEVRERLAQLGELRADDLRVHFDDLPASRAAAARIRFELPQGHRELVALVAGGESP